MAHEPLGTPKAVLQNPWSPNFLYVVGAVVVLVIPSGDLVSLQLGRNFTDPKWEGFFGPC